jgi:hypothetical protein
MSLSDQIENNVDQKMLGHTILTSQLGSAVRSHVVVTKLFRQHQKLQFKHTLVVKLTPINCHKNCTINVPLMKRPPTAPCDEVRTRERVECGSDQCIGYDQCSMTSRQRLRETDLHREGALSYKWSRRVPCCQMASSQSSPCFFPL